MARAATYLYAAGATLVLVSLALPQIPAADEGGLTAVLGAAYVVAVVLLVAFDRVPVWVFHALVAFGTLLVTTVIYFSGEGSSAYAVFYLWVALYAFYFFSRRAALVQLLLVAIAYAVVLALREPSTPAGRWVVTLGTLLVAGLLIQLLRERVERVIDRLARAPGTDSLTRLPNRRAFEERLDAELDRARRSGRSLGLLVVDIDHFKDVNERVGYHAGDDVLKRVAETLVGAKRRIDVAARVGGEEFAVIAPETDEHGAYMLAQRVRARTREMRAADELRVTVSVGIATHPGHADGSEPLLRAATHALEAAKELGRDRVVLYSAEVADVLSTGMSGGEVQDELHLATVLMLAEAIDIRDTGTARHSQTVGRLAEAMARELGLPAPGVERLRLAGLLHDVGKIGVSDSALRKPGPLSETEWVEMRRHPEIAARLLSSSHFDDIRGWVLAHHERVDGTGYPHGLTVDRLTLEARVLAVADAYEAMLNDRCYRPAIGEGAARTELRRCSGTQFDGRVVDALIRTLEREPDEPVHAGGGAR